MCEFDNSANILALYPHMLMKLIIWFLKH